MIGVVRAAVTEDAPGLGRSLRLKGWTRRRGSIFQTSLSDRLIGGACGPAMGLPIITSALSTKEGSP